MKRFFLLGFLILSLVNFSYSQRKNKTKSTDESSQSLLTAEVVKGLKFRSIGPAFTSGRIADFAVREDKPSEYYVAVASGGVWKTVNSGTTWKPIFDNQGS